MPMNLLNHLINFPIFLRNFSLKSELKQSKQTKSNYYENGR